jgi:hypothetical protein
MTRRTRTFRPTFENLETRLTPAVTYGGGPLLAHLEVEAVFLGTSWQGTAAGQQQAGQVASYLNMLTHSSYLPAIGSDYSTTYYHIGTGTYEGGLYDTLTLGSVVTDSTIRTEVDRLIRTGWLRAPDGNRRYMVFTPPNVRVQTAGGQVTGVGNGINGYHNRFADYQAGFTAYYAVITNPVGNPLDQYENAGQTLTTVTSHELAEAVTNPDLQSGWWSRISTDEIGDLAAANYGWLNGYAVQAYYSRYWNDAALPSDATWWIYTGVHANPQGGGYYNMGAAHHGQHHKPQSNLTTAAVDEQFWAQLPSTPLHGAPHSHLHFGAEG